MRPGPLLALLLAGCVGSAVSERRESNGDAPPLAPASDEPGFLVLEAPRGDGLRREPPRIVRVVDGETGHDVETWHVGPRPGGAARVSADGYLPALVTARWPGPVRLRRGTWVEFEVRTVRDDLIERRRELVDPATHRWALAPEGCEPVEFGVADLRAGNVPGVAVVRVRSRPAPPGPPARVVHVTLASDGLAPGCEAWIAGAAGEWRLEPGRPAPVPAGEPLTLRVRDDVCDRTLALEPLLDDREVSMPVRDLAAPPVVAARPVPAAASVAPGALRVSLRDVRGRYLSGWVSLDGHEPRAGARCTFDGVPAGTHRLAAWADGHEALVVPAEVPGSAEARISIRLRPLPDR